MSRLSRIVFVAGAAATLAACSERVPTAPAAPPAAAAGDLVASAISPSASCTIASTTTGYDVTVSWSSFSVTSIALWQNGASQPLAQAVLAHPTRHGSLTFTLTSAPDYAQVTGLQTGLRVLCATAI